MFFHTGQQKMRALFIGVTLCFMMSIVQAAMDKSPREVAQEMFDIAKLYQARGQPEKAIDTYKMGIRKLKEIRQDLALRRASTRNIDAWILREFRTVERISKKQYASWTPYQKKSPTCAARRRSPSPARRKPPARKPTPSGGSSGMRSTTLHTPQKKTQKKKGEVCFADVVGLKNVKQAIHETIILPMLRPTIFKGILAPVKGMLLFGPPGNGKTMIAKAIATECKATFMSISAANLTSKFVGEGEKNVRDLFARAKANQPAVIFIDEIDSLLTARGGSNENESARRMKTEFMVQMDGAKSKEDDRVFVIGATNLPDQLDDAILRRMPKRFLVPLPELEARVAICKKALAKVANDLTDRDIRSVARRADGYSCSDLTEVCKDAAMGPVRDVGGDIGYIDKNSTRLTVKLKHLQDGLGNVRPSLDRSGLKKFTDWNARFGSNLSS